jgi:hypothetical protein
VAQSGRFTRVLAVLIGIGLLFVLLLPLAFRTRGRDDDNPLPQGQHRKPAEYARGRAGREEKLSAALEVAKQLASPKLAPKPGEWLAEHPESGQLVADLRAEEPEGGWPRGRTLYLVAVGPLSEAQEALLERTRALLVDWYQTEVKLLPALPESIVPPASRRERTFGTQWQTRCSRCGPTMPRA